MPAEKPIIPQGMPNPVGAAVTGGIQNLRRIGGELPIDKYPLVSKNPKHFSPNTKLVSTSQVILYNIKIMSTKKKYWNKRIYTTNSSMI